MSPLVPETGCFKLDELLEALHKNHVAHTLTETIKLIICTRVLTTPLLHDDLPSFSYYHHAQVLYL